MMTHTSYVLLNDSKSPNLRLVRQEHVSLIEIQKDKQIVTLHFLGGQEVGLTPDQSKQFLEVTGVRLR